MTAGGAGARAAVAPLRELLGRRGVRVAGQALVEECGGDLTIASMAECLRRRGLRARLVALRAGDLALLGETLVELRDGSVGLLRAGGRGRFWVEHGGGTVAVTAARAGELLGGLAVELADEWPASGTLFARALRQCAERPSLRVAASLYVLALGAAGAVGYATPAVVRAAVDRAIPEGAARTLAALVAALATLATLQALVGNLADRAVLYLETRLSAAACRGVFEHYLSLPLPALQQCTAGRAYQALEAAAAFVRGAVRQALGGAIELLLAVGYLFWAAALAPPVAAGLAAAYGGLLLAAAAWSYPAARRRREVIDASTEQSDRLVELVRRIATVRAEAAEGWAVDRWARSQRSEQRASLRQDLSAALLNELVALVGGLALGASVLWASWACLSGGRSLGDFFAIAAAASAASASGGRLALIVAGAGPLLTQARAVDEALARQPGPPSPGPGPGPGGSAAGPRPERGIVVDRAWFRYGDDAPWIIEDFSLSVPAGAVHMIRWPSGRGKSTLLRLIAGLYAPARGAVTVQGLDAQLARHLVAYVPQGCALLAGSVRSNLRALSGDAPHGRLMEAAEATGLRAVVEAWPMGFDTIIAARGGNLSSGQQQLVVLTAALASARPVLLLDEATTHLDLILRARLARSPLLSGRTIVNVVHADEAAP
ncbi:MAG TPA: ATP-binding cassette domain-containing protein [Polyangiaceae bacterium]|nr:ATP-binding cassette domain-containing protein [Polyangiaceae bacterium]